MDNEQKNNNHSEQKEKKGISVFGIILIVCAIVGIAGFAIGAGNGNVGAGYQVYVWAVKIFEYTLIVWGIVAIIKHLCK